MNRRLKEVAHVHLRKFENVPHTISLLNTGFHRKADSKNFFRKNNRDLSNKVCCSSVNRENYYLCTRILVFNHLMCLLWDFQKIFTYIFSS